MELGPFLIFMLAKPFAAFEIALNNGRRISVTHPESISVFGGGRGIWLVLPSGQMEFIEGNAVASVRTMSEADPSNFIVSE